MRNMSISWLLLLILAAVSFGNDFIPEGAVWKYLDDGSDQGTGWYSSGFNDGSWASGPAELGFGDDDEATVLKSGFITYYFRHEFTVANPSALSGVLLRLLRDDGAVVYLNGSEVVRSNMPDGEIDYQTLAASVVNKEKEKVFHEYDLSPSDFVAGKNIIAIEIHQRKISSSDISLNLSLQANSSGSDVFRKAAYLIYNGNNTEMKIMWQLDGNYGSTVVWGENESCSLGSFTTSEYGSDHQHTYTIPSLTPGTKYYYKVTAEGGTRTGSFCTAPPSDATALKFLAYGDTRTNPSEHDIVAKSMLQTITDDKEFQTLVISVGDLVAGGNKEADWDDQFFNPSYKNIQEFLSSMPYQCCMGNHEKPGTLFQKYFAYPYVAKRYWSFDYGPVHFTVVDQYTPYGTGSEQLRWIASDLSETNKPWKILYLHEPGWSAGGNHSNNKTVQDCIQPLCREFDVSIVFAGHNHYYARALVDDVHHVTTGGGGAPLTSPDPSNPKIVSTAKSYHFCKIDINDNVLSFEACSPSGSILDSFVITREVSGNTNPAAGISLRISENPVKSFASVQFTVPADSRVTIDIFDLNGRKVDTLYDAATVAGEYSTGLNAEQLHSGVYFVRLNAGGMIATERLILMN